VERKSWMAAARAAMTGGGTARLLPRILRCPRDALPKRRAVRGAVRVGGATKDFGRFRGGVVGGGVFVWASGFRAGGPVWGYLT